MNRRSFPLVGLLALLLVTTGACDAKKEAPSPESGEEETESTTKKAGSAASEPDREPLAGVSDGTISDVRQHFVQMGRAGVEDTQERIVHLEEVAEFLADEPSVDSLDAARRAWIDAHRAWVSTEVYLYAGHPAHREGLVDRLDTWPIRPSHVDFVPGEPDAGLINQSDTELDDDTLRELHQKGGDDYATTGFHVVELLLWGWSGGGTDEQRRASAFGGDRQTAPNPDRRGRYLRRAVGLLAEDHEQLVQMWSAEPAGAARSAFLEQNDAAAIRQMLAVMKRVTVDLLGEKRLNGPLQTEDRLQLPSPFSRTGVSEIQTSLRTLHDFYHGVDARSDNSQMEGPGLRAIVSQVAPELDSQLNDQLEEAIQLADAIPKPYDEALQTDEGRPKIQKTADQIETIGQTLDQIGQKLGIPL